MTLLAVTSPASSIGGTYPTSAPDSRAPNTPFGATMDAASSKWAKAASDFLRGAGIDIYAGSDGVRVIDRYKSDAAMPPYNTAVNNGSILKNPLVLGGIALAVVFLATRKR